jgi:hypothetical protein
MIHDEPKQDDTLNHYLMYSSFISNNQVFSHLFPSVVGFGVPGFEPSTHFLLSTLSELMPLLAVQTSNGKLHAN